MPYTDTREIQIRNKKKVLQSLLSTTSRQKGRKPNSAATAETEALWKKIHVVNSPVEICKAIDEFKTAMDPQGNLLTRLDELRQQLVDIDDHKAAWVVTRW